MSEIKLDTTHANKITIYFESKLFLNSIDIIQVFIFVDIVNFHDVDISTLFYLFLKDIYKFCLYLNNIIN